MNRLNRAVVLLACTLGIFNQWLWTGLGHRCSRATIFFGDNLVTMDPNQLGRLASPELR